VSALFAHPTADLYYPNFAHYNDKVKNHSVPDSPYYDMYYYDELKKGFYMGYYNTDNPHIPVTLYYDLNYNTTRNGSNLLDILCWDYHSIGIDKNLPVIYGEDTMELKITNESIVVLFEEKTGNVLSIRLHWLVDIIFDFVYNEHNQLISIFFDDGVDRYIRVSIYYDGQLRTFGKSLPEKGLDFIKHETRIIFDGDILKYIINFEKSQLFERSQLFKSISHNVYEYNSNGDCIHITKDYMDGASVHLEHEYIEYDKKNNWIQRKIQTYAPFFGKGEYIQDRILGYR
jgi:hypothetical protein